MLRACSGPTSIHVREELRPGKRLGRIGPAIMESGGQSRMGDFTELLTVRDPVDVVAFLQSVYKVRAAGYRG